MTTESQVNIKKDYIHIISPPDFEITKESTLQQWRLLIKTCKKTKIRKVLVETKATKRNMSVVDAQTSGSFFEKEGISGLSIALFMSDYNTDKLSSFFETVAYNRGIQIKFFNDRAKAIEWLDIKKEQDKPEDK